MSRVYQALSQLLETFSRFFHALILQKLYTLCFHLYSNPCQELLCGLLVPQDLFASDLKEQHTSMFVYTCNQLQLTQLTDNNQIVIYSLIIIFEAEKFSFNLLNQKYFA
jgi:hypothetical protein